MIELGKNLFQNQTIEKKEVNWSFFTKHSLDNSQSECMLELYLMVFYSIFQADSSMYNATAGR